MRGAPSVGGAPRLVQAACHGRRHARTAAEPAKHVQPVGAGLQPGKPPAGGLEATERLAPVTWSDKTLASAAGMALARHQMRRINPTAAGDEAGASPTAA
jgi:hypothetical protein